MEHRRRAAIAAVAAGAVAVAVVIAVTRGGGGPGPSPTAPGTTGAPPATTPVPPAPPVPPWGDFAGAPPDLAAPPGGSAELAGPPDGRSLTVRRADGSVAARARLDERGATEARFYDRAGRLTVVVAGLRVTRGVSAGGARVRCGSSASAPAAFRWTRFPIRWRLAGRPPSGVSRAAGLAALRRARATWNANRSHCRSIRDRSRARFAFAGTSGRTTGRDGVSLVEFGDVDRLGGACAGTVACTITWVASGRAVESDTRIDRAHAGGFTTLRPRPGRLDLASVLVHESGHTLGFDHVSARSVVMFPVLARGGTAGRRLGRGDALASNRKYPTT